MSTLISLLRRLLWLLLLGLAGGAAVQWWRERQAPSLPAAPEWPPITLADDSTADGTTAAETPETPDVGAPAGPTAPQATASVVNALVDAPEARSSDGEGSTWVAPADDGSCPVSHPIKANDNSGIFHVPGGRFYERTKPERCYADADAAAADGYRRAKS